MVAKLIQKLFMPVLIGVGVAIVFFLVCFLVGFVLSIQVAGAFVFCDCFCLLLVFGLIIPELRGADSVIE
jgi:hypothetical protein